MKITLFYYDGFAEFEIVLVGLVFHVELVRQMGLCETEEEYQAGLRYFKNIR